MKVILRTEVERLGKAGDVVNVAVGYARNYLLPRGKALEASGKNMARIETEKVRLEKEQVRRREEAGELANRLSQVSLTVSKPAGESDRLFGSVTAMDIAEALGKEGFEIDRKKINLEEPIKVLGIYTVPVKLYPEVTAFVKLWVVKE